MSMSQEEDVDVRIVCSHCLGEMQGYSSISEEHGDGGITSRWLCHDGPGLTCYRAVTVFDHPMPCFCRIADPTGRRAEQLLTGQEA